MKNWANAALTEVFPSIYTHEANKTLRKRIDSEEPHSSIPNVGDIEAIKMECFRAKYTETFDAKNKFEDKAKTNVMGITIAITVIMGASGLTNLLNSKYPSTFFHWVSFSMLTIAIIYLLASGIGAVKVLFKENTMSTVELLDMADEGIETKKKYDDCISRNIARNTVRNNIVFSSYICIRNALICMAFLFVLISIPVNSLGGGVDNDITLQDESSISYRTTIRVPEGISITDLNIAIIQDRTTRGQVDGETSFCFVNLEGEYFVQYKCCGEEIIVEEFSCFDNVQSKSGLYKPS